MITGASTGIGRAIVLRLAREGAKVALIARDKPALSQLTVEIEGEGGEALAIAADVSDAPKYSQRPTRSRQHWGRSTDNRSMSCPTIWRRKADGWLPYNDQVFDYLKRQLDKIDPSYRD
ncbi:MULTISPECIES: SDR family NAD(P)-dependent oxidoreductase [Mesorhizobium]|uniref:SDR family NAD(P)-dependent oxidoreductase n=1 Tax=Mesorhizobium sp. TaxID=1871066 RepID=UPI000493E119|nr:MULTISPECIES: SDR family NAD(P)-dependent oxidoreductase [Mesorhizobium]